MRDSVAGLDMCTYSKYMYLYMYMYACTCTCMHVHVHVYTVGVKKSSRSVLQWING